MKYLLIVGAKSDVAKSVARKYANNGYDLYLAARNPEQLEAFATDIRVRTQREVQCIDLDILDFESHQAIYDSLEVKPEGVISLVGYLGDQTRAQLDFTEARKIIETNYTGVVSFLNVCAEDFEARKQGFIIGVSSVAGDRGRKSNYLYGSAKAALSAYLSGLRNRLDESGIYVLTVKPGFIKTQMTKGMDLPEKLTAMPDDVAEDIFNAHQKRRPVIYTKWIWRWIMFIITAIPEWKFKGMSI